MSAEKSSKAVKVIPIPHQVRDRLQTESSILKLKEFSWTPVFTGVTTIIDSLILKDRNYIFGFFL
jgi:hypothetical protein